MKTLDEVIERLEDDLHATDADSQLIMLFDRDVVDALRYLKEYRSERAMWEADRKWHLDWLEQYKEAREKHQQAVIELKKNPPLTWDELKQMTGKPVWLQWTVKGEWHHGDWNLVNAQFGDSVWLVDSNGEEFDLLKEVQGAMWQAYRKERE